jgi:hypothetical protein
MTLAYDRDFYVLLVDSFTRQVGAPPPFLTPGAPHSACWLYEEARYCVLAHDTSADPVFIYANKAAQALFEYDWSEFTTLPSRLSAEVQDRAERARLLQAVAREGFATGYRGIRIAKSGRRFMIEDGIVWQLTGRDGAACGQAATFGTWRDV